jgi:hypothetical protein
MSPDGTVGGMLAWSFWYLGELTFKWVPGVVVSLTGTAPAASQIPPPAAITQPTSVPDVVTYLQTATAPGVYDQIFHAWSTFVVLSMLVSLGFSALIIYCSIRMFQIRQLERRKFAAMQQSVAAHDVPKTQLRWQRVLDELAADNEKSWRLAILEADIMLNELLDSLGYKGETMADKMRAVERGNFRTIDMAWEAHRYRNRIAHESGIALDRREVGRIIGLYEKVFREFKFIE